MTMVFSWSGTVLGCPRYEEVPVSSCQLPIGRSGVQWYSQQIRLHRERKEESQLQKTYHQLWCGQYNLWLYGRKGYYRIAGNFRGRKLSQISWFCSYPRKFSPWNFRHALPIYAITSILFRKSFLHEMLPGYQSTKIFSLKHFLLYSDITTWLRERNYYVNIIQKLIYHFYLSAITY